MKTKNKTAQLGASLVEYALLIALVSVTVIASVQMVGRNIYDELQTTADTIKHGGTSFGEPGPE